MSSSSEATNTANNKATNEKYKRPEPLAGMRHVAIFVTDLARAAHFYVDLLGMQVEWQPDEDNMYLCSGLDNVALHKSDVPAASSGQRLDHIGFIVDTIEQVDEWYEFLLAHKVSMKSKPKTHRDGARSFYCLDPAGTLVQLIFHPPLSKGANS